jgi:hypothetical protein
MPRYRAAADRKRRDAAATASFVSRAIRRRIAAAASAERACLALFIAVAVIATEICIARRCNNFLIFRAAFDHLLAGRNLYVLYPGEHLDLFKYSPTVALLFAPFAVTSFGPALLAWNLLNVLPIYHALGLALPRQRRVAALAFTGLGLITTVDGTQSNGLIAALIVYAFVALERRRLVSGAFAIALGALIKLFPLAAVAFIVPRRDRARFIGIALLVGGMLVLLPLVVVSPSTLAAEYRWWYAMGAVDALDRGASVMRLLALGSGYAGPNWPVQLAGTAVLLLPLLRRSRWDDGEFRRAFLASVLVYCVIFNHKAEQPSFVIAVVGVAIWYAARPRTPMRDLLAGSTLIATVPILMTVAAPGVISATVEGPLLVTSACCLAVWLAMQAELLDLVPLRAARRSEFAAILDEPAV